MKHHLSSRRFVAILATVGVALVVLVGGASGAGAQDNGDYTSKPAAVTSPPPAPPAEAPAPPAAAMNVRFLAITGSDLPGVALLGTVLLAAGAGLLVLRRRSAADES